MLKIIVQRVILAAQARHAARKAREMVQRKTVLTGGGLPGKLSDCSEQGPCINVKFFLLRETLPGVQQSRVEIESFEAILPLKGKILNVEKSMAT